MNYGFNCKIVPKCPHFSQFYAV